MTFFIRGGPSNTDPLGLVSAARAAVAEVDPDRPLANVKTLSEFVDDRMQNRRYYASALSVFALMATVLAAVGVYGVMTFSVSQRTREIGIRMAMGANARDIVKLVGGRALWLITIGLLFGFLGSLGLTRLIAGQLWGITSTDPATFAFVTALLIGISIAACFFPARRAVRVNPNEALRLD